jgi:hypothetical protein
MSKRPKMRTWGDDESWIFGSEISQERRDGVNCVRP